jgi:hypothetical protein
MMALIALPGSHAGPCSDCDHLACQHDRWIARMPCVVCGHEIGYERPYAASIEPESGGWRPLFAHRECLEHLLSLAWAE